MFSISFPRLARSALSLALFVSVSLRVSAEEAAANKHAHHGGMMHGKKGPDLGSNAEFDAQGHLWAVHKLEEKIVLRRSDDLGKTWAAPVVVSAEPTDPGADARPKLALGKNQEIYLTWTHPMTKPFSGEIRFARSLDGGVTFEGPITVHADKQEITHRFDAIAVAPNGDIFVAWVDKRDVVAAQAEGAAYRGAAIYFAVSSDQGKTFRGDFKVAEHSCECCRIALAVRPDGAVTALWRHVFEPQIRDHAMAVLKSDGTATPMRRATFEDWNMDACPHHGPALAETDGKEHAVWFTQAPGKAGVYYGSFRNDRPDTPRRIGDDTAERPDICASGDQVALVWKQFDGEKSHLCGMISKDGGLTWKEHRLGSTAGASDRPHVIALKDQFYVVWNTRNEPLSVTAFPQ